MKMTRDFTLLFYKVCTSIAKTNGFKIVLVVTLALSVHVKATDTRLLAGVMLTPHLDGLAVMD